MSSLIIAAILERAAIILGKITKDDVKKVLVWIDTQAELHPEKPGLQKLDTVLDRFTDFFGKNESARTVVQMLYSAWKLRREAKKAARAK